MTLKNFPNLFANDAVWNKWGNFRIMYAVWEAILVSSYHLSLTTESFTEQPHCKPAERLKIDHSHSSARCTWTGRSVGTKCRSYTGLQSDKFSTFKTTFCSSYHQKTFGIWKNKKHVFLRIERQTELAITRFIQNTLVVEFVQVFLISLSMKYYL